MRKLHSRIRTIVALAGALLLVGGWVAQGEEAPFRTIRMTYQAQSTMFDENEKPVFVKEWTEVKTVDAVQGKYRIEKTGRALMGEFEIGQDELSFYDGKRLYHVDAKRNTATYTEWPTAIDKKEIWRMVVGAPLIEEAETSIGQEEILGRPCNIYEEEGFKHWVWKGLLLKEESHLERIVQGTVAVQIEEEIEVPQALFELPEGMEAKTMEASIADFTKETFGTVEPPVASDPAQAPGVQANEDEIGLFDLGMATFDVRAEEKIERAIESDSELTRRDKEEAIRNFKTMLAEQKKALEPARTEEGRIDLDKAVRVFSDQRDKARTSGAISTCMMVVTACDTYALDHDTYPETLGDLRQGEDTYGLHPEQIDRIQSEEGILGYRFRYTRVDPDHYELLAEPVGEGLRTIFVDERGVFRYDGKTGPAIEPDDEESMP